MSLLEKEYRNMVNRLAFALLVFSCLFLIFDLIVTLLPYFTALLSPSLGEIVYQVLYGLLYAAVFLIPALFFGLISKGRPTVRMYATPRLDRRAVLYLFVGLAIIRAAAFVNAYLADLFTFSSQVGGATVGMAAYTNAQLALKLLVMAVIPAFVEEFLFRGVVLSNLLPFGRVSAIVASAVLFGVMHQNVSQLLYTVVAGLVIGYIYVKTRSLWACILLHFVNNFLSVLQLALYARLEYITALTLDLLIQGLLFVLGMGIWLWLLLQKGRARSLQEPAAEQEEKPLELDTAISFGRRVRLFFSPAMIAFVAVNLIQAIGNLLTIIVGNTM